MKIHEYQARELLRAYGAPVPEGITAASPEEVCTAAERYCAGGEKCVIKAQVHAGDRGKSGGVRLVETAEQAEEIARALLGSRLRTHQTGPEGVPVEKLLVTPAVRVRKEYYLSVTADAEAAGLRIVASGDGGTEIEETAREHPERIEQISVSLLTGFQAYQGRQAAQAFGFAPGSPQEKELQGLLRGLVRLYVEKDCTLVEINPLVLTEEGRLVCLDAKINFDDNALFRHPELTMLQDMGQEDPAECAAAAQGMSYVRMDGSVGCLVNGAGLAMATMDILQEFGAAPANFLDVGGSATAERVRAAFELLLGDPRMKAVFVNIFGGIMHCDVIARGITEAARQMELHVPLIVRLEGTNARQGREILAASGLETIPAVDMADGARKAAAAAGGTSV